MRHPNLLLFLLGVLAVFVIGVTLQELQVILVPFVLAALLSIIFRPVVVELRRRRVPTVVALFLVLLSLILLLVLLSLLLYSSLGAFIEALPRYEARFAFLLDDALAALQRFAQEFDLEVEDLRSGDLIQLSTVSGFVAAGLGSFVSLIGFVFLVMLFMLFMLAGSGELAAKIPQAFPADYARIATVLENVSGQVRQYLITKTLISASTAVITFFVLWSLEVDFPLIWGFLAFVLNFIPSLGSIVATLLPFVLSLLQFDTMLQPFLVLVLLGLTQVSLGNILEPRLMAFNLNLSALFVLVSLIFWGWLWGVWGMLLAVPLTAAIKILCENVEPLRPVSVLMSGRVNP